MTAYVTVPSSFVVLETAGQENVVAGPRVCVATGCNVETYVVYQHNN